MIIIKYTTLVVNKKKCKVLPKRICNVSVFVIVAHGQRLTGVEALKVGPLCQLLKVQVEDG